MYQASLVLDDTSILLFTGKILSGIALVLIIATLVNIWRRRSFPAVSYGSIVLSHGRMRWLWLSLIVGATALTAAANPIAQTTSTSEDAELLEAATLRRQSTLSTPYPFYRYERVRVFADGELAVDNASESFHIPWPLLSALLAYVVLVMRWNPENRLAIRMLKGPKRRRARDERRAAGEPTSGG